MIDSNPLKSRSFCGLVKRCRDDPVVWTADTAQPRQPAVIAWLV
jgi:hypothetical protein